MSAGNEDNSATANDDTTRYGTFIETRSTTNGSNIESIPSTPDEDVERTALQIDTRSVVGHVENKTVPK
jgi:hypothetical protein